ncbi:MAG: PAS domain-containing protein [bacterium]|nr:PAS domain-containing protein [bacterium]
MSTHDETDFSKLPGLVVFKDKEGHFLWANDEAVRMAGFDDFSQLAGKTDYDESVSWHKGAEEYRKLEIQAMDGGCLHSGIETASKNGVATRFLTYKAPTRNANGDVTGILLVSLEVSEEILQQLNDALK